MRALEYMEGVELEKMWNDYNARKLQQFQRVIMQKVQQFQRVIMQQFQRVIMQKVRLNTLCEPMFDEHCFCRT